MITILGATGNIGSKVTDMLLRKGEKVRVVARSADRLKPFVSRGAQAYAGDAGNGEFLKQALKGSDGVFTLIPPNYGAKDFLAYQDGLGASIVKAVKAAGVKYVVNLSSVGADLSGGAGPITGLHRQEERLNGVPGLNVLHIRAAFFMENLLMNIPLIRGKGVMGSAIRGDLKMSMIATKDIAAVVAHLLRELDFKGSSVRYLLGPRDISLSEAAGIIGAAIGIPDLKYVPFPYDEAEKGLVAAGLSPDVARLFIEMHRAFNEDRVIVSRTPGSGTPTTLEEFCRETFVPLYAQAKAA